MKQWVLFVAFSVVVAVLVGATLPTAAAAPQQQAIVVTSTADSGAGTLREALERATAGTTITFDPTVFPPDNPATIIVTSPLPDLTQGQVTIDASNAGVILDGSRLPGGEGINGLTITSSGNVIRGLQILNFPGDGVAIVHDAQSNVIGGDRTVGTGPIGEGNVISGNGETGLTIGVGTSNNVATGNYIGIDLSGGFALPNRRGVVIGAAADNTIGGRTEGEGNIISGSELGGVVIAGAESVRNRILGNYIGTNASGTAPVANGIDGVWIGESAQYNIIGGATAVERNIISGNGSNGVVIDGGGHNTISGNYIGTDATGASAVGNTSQGVSIVGGAQYNVVGGATAAERNVISGNDGDGVHIGGPGTAHNLVLGDFIGLDVSGTQPLPNSHGVSLRNGASHNMVQGNVISSHQQNPNIVLWDPGTSFNVITGNLLGTDASGTVAIPSCVGVGIRGGASDNRIGGSRQGEGNLISGNTSNGIDISEGSARNEVVGNLIGTDITGSFAIPNDLGILIRDAPDNFVGSSAEGEGNVISGNAGVGLMIVGADSMHNQIIGNFIGTDMSGTRPLGNRDVGLLVNEDAGPNIIGPGNIIAYNGTNGVQVRGSDTLGNTITGNSIHNNEGLGIQNSGGGNTGLSAPIITYVGTRVIRGTAPPNSTVEVFSDEEDEGLVFEGNTVADENGNFTFTMPVDRFTRPHVTATATDTDGNTSQYSSPGSPRTTAVTRALPGIVAPTQISVEPRVVATNLGLALFCVLFFGLTSTVFNSILIDYRDELLGAFGRLVPRSLARALGKAGSSLRGVAEQGRARLLLMWLIVLLVTSLIESFLDPEVGLLTPERLGLLITLFLSALAVSGLELGADLYARRRWAPTISPQGKVQWIGIAIAVACVILSRALDFKPGYLYGIVGAMYLMPKLVDVANSGKRAVLVLLTILAGGLILWIATAFLPAPLAELEPLFLTIFLISLQGVFFALLPFALTDGGNIWNWRRSAWFLFFSVVFFCFYHFLLNPNASDVQALQQNGVQTLLILIVIFGLATLILWSLFPLRLGHRRARKN